LQQFYVSLGNWDGLDFNGEEAAAMAGIAPAAADTYLQELFCLSWVRRGRIDRYRLIPVVRDFAREKQGCWHKQCQ
jgi:hypothetical protein